MKFVKHLYLCHYFRFSQNSAYYIDYFALLNEIFYGRVKILLEPEAKAAPGAGKNIIGQSRVRAARSRTELFAGASSKTRLQRQDKNQL